MSNNYHGFANEKTLAKYLNNKNFESLNDNMKNFISFVFSRQIANNEVILSDTTKKIGMKNPKPDIWVKIGAETKNISVKNGSGNSVHQEPLDEFCSFLKQIQATDDTINKLRLYHYGDGTYDGSGETRLSTPKVKVKYSTEITSVNTELNQPNFLAKIFDRILFSGSFEKPIVVDAVYHGSLDSGCFANREEILNYLISNTNPCEMKCIKFSQLTYQPWSRDPLKKAKYPNRRYVMQVKWGTIVSCIEEIAKGRKTNGN